MCNDLNCKKRSPKNVTLNMSGAHLRRPRPTDTEDTLLAEQEAFRSSEASVTSGNIVSSRVKERPTEEAAAAVTKETLDPPVLTGHVVERRPIYCRLPERPKEVGTKSFPAVFKLTADDITEKPEEMTTTTKKSLFSQAVASRRGEKTRPQEASRTSGTTSRPLLPSRSAIVEGSSLEKGAREAEKIHLENLERIQKMTLSEIEEARRELLGAMKPETVAFLKTKALTIASEKQEDEVPPEKKVRESAAEVAASFLHMDKPEPEKMEWMNDVDTAKAPPPTQGFSARFDFEGSLLPYEADIPVTAGLYHHGEEPGRPGYTPEELLTLARSSNHQQRVMAFNVISKIVKNFKLGLFDSSLEQNVLVELLNAGLLTILRISLDEKEGDSLREASLACLRQVLDNQFDEFGLDAASSTHLGHIQPSLPTKTLRDPAAKVEYIRNKGSLQDDEVMSLDCVLGLLRTDLLQRFYYILTKLNPSPSATVNLLCVLIRISRHSLQSAMSILNHSGLLIEVGKLLQESSSDAKITFACLKLYRVLSAWSRSTASSVFSDASTLISRLVAADSGALGPSLEALRLWDCLLRYGYGQNLFLDLYPLIIRFFVSIRIQLDPRSFDQGSDGGAPEVNLEVACGLLKVYESSVCLHLEEKEQSLHEFRPFKEQHRILEDILSFLPAYLDQRNEMTPFLRLKFFSVGAEAFATSLKGFVKSTNAVEAMDQCLEFSRTTLSRILRSSSSIVKTLEEESVLLSDLVDGRSRDPDNLPSLGITSQNLKLVAREDSPFRLLAGVSHLALTLLRLNPCIGDEPQVRADLSSWLLSLGSYPLEVLTVSRKMGLKSNWFVKDETFFLHNILLIDERIRALKLEGQAAGSLLCLLHTEHKHMAEEPFYKVFRNADYKLLEEKFSHLGMEEVLLPPAPEHSKARVVEIMEVYARYLPRNTKNVQIETLTERNSGELLFPSDWRFLPILEAFTKDQEEPLEEERQDSTSSEYLKNIELSLHWISLELAGWKRSMTPSEASLYLSRLMTVFMFSNSIFLEKSIKKYLGFCFCQVVKVSEGKSDFAQPIPGVTPSFTEFYAQAWSQYGAVSYGDSLFSLALILPTIKESKLKTIMWLDNADMLNSFRLSERDLPDPIDIDWFVCKEKQDPDGEGLIEAYVRAILGGKVTELRTPLLFKIAKENIAQNKEAKVISRCRNALVQHGVAL